MLMVSLNFLMTGLTYTGWGGINQIIFLTGCAARYLKPLPISKDFSPSKNGWFYRVFFPNFCKSGPISKGFSTPKMAGFTFFFALFIKWDPLLRIFWTKMGPMSKDFWWKVTHLGSTSLYALTCEYPPPPPMKLLCSNVNLYFPSKVTKTKDGGSAA